MPGDRTGDLPQEIIDRVHAGEVVAGDAATQLSSVLGLEEWDEWEALAAFRDVDLDDPWIWEAYGERLVDHGAISESRLDDLLEGASASEEERESARAYVREHWLEDYERLEFYNVREVQGTDERSIVGVARSHGGGWSLHTEIVAIVSSVSAARGWIAAQDHTLVDWAGV